MTARICTPLKSGASTIVLAFVLSGLGGAAFAKGGLPAQGHYISGHGAIERAGGALTVEQSSRTGIVDWKSFSIGKNNSVTFDNGNGATLNRVTGANLSRIAGQLHGTGSIYLINNAGVVVTGTGRVLTQGNFVASSRNADEDAFSQGARRLHFTGGANGSVVNRGRIVSAAGDVSLNGRNVTESGLLVAHNASLIASNNMNVQGHVEAGGRHGHGGNVETSGHNVRIAGATISARNWLIDPTNLDVDSTAASTINASLGAGTNVTLKTKASGATGPGVQSSGPGDITVSSAISWSTTARLTLDAYHGINVSAPIAVDGTGILNLKTNDGGHNGVLQFTGGSVNFAKTTATLNINSERYVIVKNLPRLIAEVTADPGGNFALGATYNAMGDGTYNASPIQSAFSGNFEGLGNNINKLKITSKATAVGLFGTQDAGSLIENIQLNGAVIKGNSGSQSVGALVGNAQGTIRNAIVMGSVTATTSSAAGGLVGLLNGGTIVNSHASNSVDGNANAGGLVGDMEGGRISDSYATGAANGEDGANSGGLVGIMNDGKIVDSHATGDAFADGGGAWVGGLVGEMDGTASITGSYATGGASGSGNNAGYAGLVGFMGPGSHDTISGSFASGNTNGGGSGTGNGGLVGYIAGNGNNTITDSYAVGSVTGGDSTSNGGLVGLIQSGGTTTIARTFANGAVSGGASTNDGGLIGINEGTVTDSYSTGGVSAGTGSKAGGLVGWNRLQGATSGSIATSYSTGAPTGGAGSVIGGLVGEDDATAGHIVNAYWDTDTSGISTASQGAGNTANDSGITGLTTTQLQSGLPAGFSGEVWGSSGGYPFLLSLTP